MLQTFLLQGFVTSGMKKTCPVALYTLSPLLMLDCYSVPYLLAEKVVKMMMEVQPTKILLWCCRIGNFYCLLTLNHGNNRLFGQEYTKKKKTLSCENDRYNKVMSVSQKYKMSNLWFTQIIQHKCSQLVLKVAFLQRSHRCLGGFSHSSLSYNSEGVRGHQDIYDSSEGAVKKVRKVSEVTQTCKTLLKDESKVSWWPPQVYLLTFESTYSLCSCLTAWKDNRKKGRWCLKALFIFKLFYF